MKKVVINTSDGAKIGSRFFEPKGSRSTIVIHVPGMSGHIYNTGFYEVMAKKLVQSDIAFLTTQSRTYEQNKKLGDNYFTELFDNCIYELDALNDWARQKGYENVWFQGSSLGPAKVVHWYATQKPSGVNGLIFLSPSDILGLVNDPLGVKDHDIMLPQAKKLIQRGNRESFIDHQLWGVKTLTAEAYLNLFGEKSQAAIFNYHNPVLGWGKVNKIDVPVLAITGTEDDGVVTVMDPYKAMDMLELELNNCPLKKTLVLKGANHNFDGFEDEITEEVIGFVKA